MELVLLFFFIRNNFFRSKITQNILSFCTSKPDVFIQFSLLIKKIKVRKILGLDSFLEQKSISRRLIIFMRLYVI